MKSDNPYNDIRIVLIVLMFLPTAALADRATTEIGLRGNVELAGGTPANDILGHGIYSLYRFDRDWALGVAVDRFDYDFENPSKVIGINSTAPDIIDASATSTMFSVWGERQLRSYIGRGDLVISLGMGINNIDVHEATGPVSGGGTWQIQTEVDTDFVLIAGMGIKYPLDKTWAFNGGIGSNYHFAKWQVQDLQSGTEHTINGFYSWSIRLGISRVFK